MADDEGETRWCRPAVQPHDVADMLAAPLSAPRPTPNVSYQQQQQQQNYPQQAPPRHNQPPPATRNKSKRGGHLVQPHATKNPLLAWRVWCADDYAVEFRSRKRGPTKHTPGQTPTPIPVPLEHGENVHEYEQCFLAWLRTKNMTLGEVERNANHERSFRINFANLRVRHCKTQPLAAKPLDPKPPRLNVVVADHSAASVAPQLRKRDRSASPPASRKRGARVVLKEEDDKQSEYDCEDEQPRKIRLKKSGGGGPSPSPARSVSSTSTASSHFAHGGGAPPPLRPPAVAAPAVSGAGSSVAPPGKGSSAVSVAPVKRPEELCVAKLPGARAPVAAFVAAYVSCSCRQCMQDWNLMLTDRLHMLESDMQSMREHQWGGKSVENKKPRVTKDETTKQDAKASSIESSRVATASEGCVLKAENGIPSEASSVKSSTAPAVAASADHVDEMSDTEDTCSGAEPSSKATAPMIEAPAAAAATITTSTASTSSAIGALAGDPIKTRMVDEYNALNRQILLNEKVVEDSLQRVQATMLTDMTLAMQEHEQVQQVQAAIESDVASRDKALAILIAYCWAYRQEALFEQIDKLGTLNIAHVQSVSHAKCAAFAAQIEDKHEFLASLKDTLDQIILQTSSSSQSSESAFPSGGFDELSGLGRQIALEEQALAALEQHRMDEFMRLFQFSHAIRSSCRAALEGRQ